MTGRKLVILRTLALGLLFFTGLTLAGGTAQAEDATLNLMVGVINWTPLKKYVRLPEGTCVVEKVGDVTQTVTFENGYLSLQVPNPGTTKLTIYGFWDYPDFPGRRFEVVFDEEGGVRAFDLDATDVPDAGRRDELSTGQSPDGSYHFEFLKDDMFIFQWADPQGPIMGRTLDWFGEEYNYAPRHSELNYNHRNGFTLFRAWTFSNFTDLSPVLIVTWIHPDLTRTERRYILGEWGVDYWGIDPDGSHWLSTIPVDGEKGISALIWKWRIDYVEEFVQSLARGTHTVVYQLENPNGQRSNTRLETFTVVSFDPFEEE
ncbi:MAG: hypothetical protein JRJ59_07025 [Deltaproteobacteria bacterium]|nr:hypothetical protein [Deltaproteobacteria bacterium]